MVTHTHILIEMVELSLMAHHTQARKTLKEAIERGELTEEQASEKFQEWLDKRRGKSEKRKSDNDPEIEQILDLIGEDKDKFTMSCPIFGAGTSAYADLPPIGRRLVLIFGPTSHNRRVWSLLDRLIKRKTVTRPIAMEIYRVWSAMVKSAGRRNK